MQPGDMPKEPPHRPHCPKCREPMDPLAIEKKAIRQAGCGGVVSARKRIRLGNDFN